MARLLLRDLTPGTAYKVQIRAVEGDSTSDWSRLFTLTTTSDTNAPDTPQWAVSNDWVVNGDTFVANWQPLNFTLDNNRDFSYYEIEFGDGTTTRAYRTTNTTYTLTFDNNRTIFGTAKPTVTARVRAVDNVGNASAWNTLKSATNPAPSAPASVTVDSGINSLAISWASVSDIDLAGYNVYVGTTAGFAPSGGNRIYSGNGTRTTYVTATTGTFYVKVRAVDKFNQESTDVTGSGSITSPFNPDVTAPATPTSLTATMANNPNGIGAVATVTWNEALPAQNDLAGFKIRWRKTGDTIWNQENLNADTTFVSGTSYTTTVQVPTAYVNHDFQIKAYDWTDNESAWTATSVGAGVANARPANVASLSAVAGRDSITFSWPAVADQDIANYELQFTTDSSFSTVNGTYLTGTSRALTVSGLSPNTQYYARVRAVDTGGLTSLAYTATVPAATTTGTFPLSDGNPPASSPTPTVTSGIGYLFVSWSPLVNNDPVTYEVHVSTSSGFTPSAGTKALETASTGIVLKKDGSGATLTNGTTYYVKLIAKDRDGSAAAGSQGSGAPSLAQIGDIVQIDISNITNGVSTGQLNSSLNGKNKINFSTVAPVNGTDTGILGDTWYVRPSGASGQITAVYELTTAPSTWTSRLINGLAVDNLDAGRITSGFIGAQYIAANTITADKLAVGDLNNYATNYGFEDAALRTKYVLGTGQTYVSDATSHGGSGYSVNIVPNATAISSTISEMFPVAEGDELYITWWARRASADFSAQPVIRTYALDGTTTIDSTLGLNVAFDESTRLAQPLTTTANNTWVKLYALVTVGAGAQFARVLMRTQSAGTTGSWRIDDIVVRRANRGSLIVDGTLSATKIATGNLSAATITLQTGGIIQTANSEVTLSSAGITVTGTNSSITATAITTGQFQAGNVLTVNGDMRLNGNMQVQTGGYIKSTEYTGTTQGSNPSGLGWYLGRDGLRISSGIVSASALGPGSIGTNAGIIDIVSGATIRTNGGAIVSNTYGGTTYNAAATAGYFLDDTHFHIVQGQISAAALITSTISTASITLGGTAEIKSDLYVTSGGTSGYRLTNTGLTVMSGTIAASALVLQQGQNLMPYPLATMEFPSGYYLSSPTAGSNISFTTSTGLLASIDTATVKYNAQSLRIEHTSATARLIHFAATTTTDNITIPENGDYIVSFWVYPTVTNAITMRLYNGATQLATQGTGGLAANTWQRKFFTVTGVTAATAHFTLVMPAAVGVWYIDGIQIEKKLGGSDTPSPFSPPSTTTITGGMIKTGSIQSNSPAVVWNDATQTWVADASKPAWYIDMEGDASFGNARVRGSLVVGELDVNGNVIGLESVVQSANYVPGTSGWILRSNGFAEFRQVVADSFDGSAIKTDTLDVSKLTSSNLNKRITLDTGASLAAEGPLGEEVSLGGYGFRVFGPDQVGITNKALTSNVATLTTAVAHNFTVGNIVIVTGVDSTFDGTYTIATTPTTTSFTYALTAADVVSVAASGIAKSKDSTNQNLGPKYIDFPTDGSQPNIISGTLTADTLIVTDGMAMYGINNIQNGATLTIASSVLPPKSGPTVTVGYNDKQLSGTKYTSRGAAVGHDGNYYVLGDGGANQYCVTKHSATNGSLISTPLDVSAFNTLYTYALAFTYSANTNKYYVLLDSSNRGAGNTFIRVYDTTFAQVGSFTVDTYNLSGNADDIGSSALGWDYVNNRLLLAYKTGGNLEIRSFTMNGSGVPTALNSTLAVPSSGNISAPAFIAFGAFDIGTNVYVYKDRSYNASYDIRNKFYVMNSSGVAQPTLHWPGAYNTDVYGGWWNTADSKFYDLSSNKSVRQYVDGDSYTGRTNTITNKALTSNVATLTTSAAHDLKIGDSVTVAGVDATFNGTYKVTDTPTTTTFTYAKTNANVASTASGGTAVGATANRYVAYSWYDNNATGGTHETNLSPATTITNFPKRASINVTISQIPGLGASGQDSPNQARIYLAHDTSTPGSSNTTYRLTNTLTYPSTSAYIDPYRAYSSTTPPSTNGFNVDATSVGIIQSTSGNSFWKGDDTAAFYKLTLTSNEEATTASGNKPALRIGNIDLSTGLATGQHLRIDSDEITAMATESSVGTLYLNGGGLTVAANTAFGTFKIGSTGTAMVSLWSGRDTMTAHEGSGIWRFTHNLNITGNYQVFLQIRDNTNFRFLTVTEKNANNFKARVVNETNSLVTTGIIDFDWLIIDS